MFTITIMTLTLAPFLNRVTLIDACNGLDQLPEGSVHCVCTSPPYWALRNYGDKVISSFPEITFTLFGLLPVTVPAWTGQLGLEPDPMMFTAHIVYIFRKVHRVLRKDGTCWVNLGDSYAAADKKKRTSEQAAKNSTLVGGTLTQQQSIQPSKITGFLKPKDLCGIPWMVAFALRDDGWYLRQDIIWSKPNPMPESVSDRCTKAHEYIFLLTKSKKYFYDAEAIKKPAKELLNKYAWNRAIDGSINDSRKGTGDEIRKAKQKEYKNLPDGQANIRKARNYQRGHIKPHQGFNNEWDQMTKEEQTSVGANKRSVWEIATRPFTDAHFATFPEEIPNQCIKAGCPEYVCAECGTPYTPLHSKTLIPTAKAGKKFIVDERNHNADKNDQGANREKDGHKQGHIYESTLIGYEKKCKCAWHPPVGGVVLDMFAGTNKTGITAKKLNRNYVAFEINPEYEPIYKKRTHNELGLFQ